MIQRLVVLVVDLICYRVNQAIDAACELFDLDDK